MVGFVDLIPQFFAGWRASSEEPQPNCQAIKGLRPNSAIFVRAGLKKDTWQLNQAGDLLTPPYRDPCETMVWSDGRFLKTWQWDKINTQTYNLTLACDDDPTFMCSDTNGGANNIVPPIADADQPTYIINTEVATTCNVFTAEDTGTEKFPYQQVSHGEAERKIRISLNSRRRIRLRESEGLTLWVNYTAPDYVNYLAPNTGLHTPCVRLFVRPHVKLLLETS